MTNIVMLVHGRYRLTMQAIDSIRQNTKRGEYTLTIVYDWDSDFRVRNYLVGQADRNPKDTTLIQVHGSRHCLGALKNLGIAHSMAEYGTKDYLCVLDNDVYMFQNWLPTLISKYDPQVFAILGGVRHPFHQSNETIGGVDVVDAAAGYCHFLSWQAYGHLCMDFSTRRIMDLYVSDAPGIGQSEDFQLCQRARQRLAKVGYVNPPVMAHTGITNSKGEPIAGADLIERVPGVLYL